MSTRKEVWYRLIGRIREMERDTTMYGVHNPPPPDGNYGHGFADWQSYYIGQPYAAQYMSVKRITGDSSHRDSLHYNLCGELAVLASLNHDIQDGFRVFDTLNGGRDILNNNRTTAYWDLVAFYEALGHEAEYRGGGMMDSPDEVSQPCKVIALVNIAPNGILTPVPEYPRDIAHWVWVYEVLQDYVTVYNPFMNRLETYTTTRFFDSFKSTDGNSGHYIAVVCDE